MTLKFKFLLFAGLMHLAMLVLAYRLLQVSPYWFIAAEVLIVVSLASTWYLYRAFIRPFNLASAGIESIQDKDFSMKFVKVGQPELDRLIDVYNRMIDQLRQERILQNEKHYLLERLIGASPSGIILLDFDGHLETINPTAARWLHVPPAERLGQSLAELPAPWGPELTALEVGQPRVFSADGIHTYKCQKSHFIDRGFPHHFIVIEELTEEIVRKEKYAYEKVIRMMSHEINNSIGAINSILTSFGYYAHQLEPEHREDYEQALQVCLDRNAHLAQFMANFANVVRIPPPHKAPTDLHELLQGIHRLMQHELERRDISWHWDLAPGPLPVDVDVEQLEQVLINVTKNAIEAVEAEGFIRMRTQQHPPTLRIEDNGSGIPEEVRERLFTPFFSTKRDGQGIGLTMIREILLNHGFPFSLSTDEQGLTAFSIRFVPERAKVGEVAAAGPQS